MVDRMKRVQRLPIGHAANDNNIGLFLLYVRREKR